MTIMARTRWTHTISDWKEAKDFFNERVKFLPITTIILRLGKAYGDMVQFKIENEK